MPVFAFACILLLMALPAPAPASHVRLEPGICCRLWQQAEEHGFRPQQRPDILDADLAPFCLQLAVWGARRPADLPWLDLPPKAHLAVAREQLAGLGAIEPGTEELLPVAELLLP